MKKILLLATTIFCSLNLTIAQPGKLDPSFANHGVVKTDLGKNYKYPSLGRKVLTTDDGSSYLMLHTNGQAVITKRLPDGSVDSSYGQNGFSVSVNMEHASTAVLQPDGKILVGGSNVKPYAFYSALSRFNADGSLDNGFGDNGIREDFSDNTSTPDVIVIQNNKKIAVGAGNNLTVFNSNGSFDNTFNGDGRQTNYDFQINGVAIQSDGKVVVAGNPYPGDTSFYFVARYNANGSLDKTFGNGGTQKTLLNAVSNFANSVLIQNDGKIVVGGTAIIRYNTDGSLDSSFSDDGIVNTNFVGNYEQVYSLALEANGKIVVAGNTLSNSLRNFTIARYNNDGSIDKTFSQDGMLANDFEIASIAVQQDSKIIAAGSVNSNFVLARYTAKGTPDNAFDKDGKLTDSIHSGYTVYNGTAIQKDGKIVAAGRTWNGNDFDFAIARYNINGSLDNTFGSDGVQTTDFASKIDYANAVAIQNDGKIVVVGYSGKSDTSIISVARYNPDGSLDNTFGSNGKLQTDFGLMFNRANSLAIQSDGKIVVVGEAYIKDSTGYPYHNFSICRYNTNGSLDKTFDKDGKQTILIAVPNENDGGPGSTFDSDSYASSVAIQKDGKIVVGGIATYGMESLGVVVRLNTEGSIDNTFGGDGKAFAGSYSFLSFSVAIQNDKKIVVGGGYNKGRYSGFASGNFISRLNIDGSYDSSFLSKDTERDYDYYYSPAYVGNVMAIQSDGQIVVAGSAFTRYTANGSLDSTFGINGIQATKIGGKNNFISAIAISGNKLYGAGTGRSPGPVGLVARFFLDNENSTPPTVSLTTPTNNATYLAPAYFWLTATASDADGAISKVEFYNGTHLLHTETVTPYGFRMRNLPVGNYIFTAKAYDNSGLVTTSAPVHISVVPNKPPIVSIIKPLVKQTVAAPGYIHLEADAKDVDGRIARVEFYNGSTLIRTEYYPPYTYVWKNVQKGTYTVTAVAVDNWAARTTSAPVTIRVVNPPATVANKPFSEDDKTDVNGVTTLNVSPNPANDILNIYTRGLWLNKGATISVISASGVVVKTMQSNSSAKIIRLDVSKLVSGVYTIKILCGDKLLSREFIKL